MARPLRIEYPDAHYHVMSRGNERHPIVRDDADLEKRLDWFRRTVETDGWRLHAFALMNNHDHLFVETPEANLSAGMQFLNGSYPSYFNRRHRRSGHLFQGCYKAQLVEEEGYHRSSLVFRFWGYLAAGVAQKRLFLILLSSRSGRRDTRCQSCNVGSV